jgi:hypothetical protein
MAQPHVSRIFPRIFFLILSGVVGGLVAGCNLKLENPKDDPNVAADYVQSGLAGSVFGSPWTAVTAAVRSLPGTTDEIALEVFAEPMANVCLHTSFATKSSVSLILPKSYATGEYVYQLGSSTTGHPLAFRSAGAINKELIADLTKLRIDSLTETGFEAELFAHGADQGVVSQINGHISVVDCAKVADFSVWNELVGTYRLASLDGQTQDGRASVIELDGQGQFYDRASKQYLQTMLFPLYKNINGSVTEKFNFGPMNGLGLSHVTTANGSTTFTYSYNGPVTYLGRPILLYLDLRVVKTDARLDVAYTLEIPHEVSSTTHQFVLLK